MTTAAEYKKALENFYKYLAGVLVLYQNIIPVLKDELRAIEQDSIKDLNESLKPQQALLLHSRTFSRNLSEHFSALGISGTNLTEMIQRLPREEQLRFYALIGQFEQTAEEVNFYKEKCRVLLQSKLYRIDMVLSKQDRSQDHATYDQNATEVRGSLFSKSFETKI